MTLTIIKSADGFLISSTCSDFADLFWLILTLNFIKFNLELSDTQRLEIIHECFMVLTTLDKLFVFLAYRWHWVLRLPLDLIVKHGLVRLIGSETQLGNMDWLWCSTVDILIKFESKLHDVDAEILPVTIVFIGEVLKTCSDDVSVNRKQSILNGRFWNLMDGDRGSMVRLSGNRVDALLIVEDEEILQRLLSIQLPLSLDWFTLNSVEDLHLVLGGDSET